MLVLTPAPHPTECLSGYLLRLGTVNGYSMPYHMVSHLQPYWVRNAYRYVTAKDLRDIAGLDQETAERVCLSSKRGVTKGVVSLLGMELHASEARMEVLRICPLCVEETGRHEAAWHLRLVTHCPVHRIPLLEKCAECGDPLVWNRPSVAQCRCGANLPIQGERSQCSEMLGDLLQTLRVSLYGAACADAFPEGLKHLEHLDLYSISRLVFVLCRLVRRFEGTFEEKDRDEQHYVERVAEVLGDWPKNFHSFITQHYEPALVHNRFSFRQIFDWAYFKLEKNLKVRGSGFSFLTDELRCIGAKYLNRDRLTRSGKVLPLSEMAGKWGSIPEAAEILGIDPRTVLTHVHKGRIPAKKALVTKRNRNFVIDLDWARQARFTKYPSVPIQKAASRLGFPVPMLRMLRETNVYEAHFSTLRDKGYALEDVERFEQILRKVAKKYSTDGTIGGIVYRGTPLTGKGDLVTRANMLKGLIAETTSEMPPDEVESVIA